MTSQTSVKVLPLERQKEVKENYESEKSFTKLDYKRDKYLTDFGKATLIDRYLLPGEKFQDMFWRVAKNYSDNQEHAKRIYDYL